MGARSGKRATNQIGLSGDREDIFLVGEIAEVLSSNDLFGSLETALQILLDATQADDTELFIAENLHGDLLLAICNGEDSDALCTRSRFAHGVGYPGIVVKEKKPLVTDQLRKDSRYLRTAAMQCGIRSYACIPLTDFGAGPLGSLHLAWHQSNVPLQRFVRLLRRVANPLSMAIYAGLADSRMSVRAALDRATGNEPREDWLGNMLHVFQNQTGAGGGSALLFDRDQQLIVQSVSSGDVLKTSKGALDPEQKNCIDLCGRHGVVLNTRSTHHLESCKRLANAGHVACCAPLILNDRIVGRILLDYGKDASQAPNKEMIRIMVMADEVASHIPPHLLLDRTRAETRNLPQGLPAISEKSLVLECLGGFSVIKNGTPVTDSSFCYRSKARTLLKLLLERAGKPVNKDALVELLWPDAEGFAAINRLHGVVHALRTAIEPNLQKKDWIYILRDGNGYRFNTDSPLIVDFFEFRRLLHAASLANKALAEDEEVSCLRKAIALYQGDLYENESDADQFEAEREYLRQSFITAVKRLVEISISRGELEEACGCLRNTLRVYADDESLHQSLIMLLLMQGNRSDAFKQYHRCVEILRRELDVEPLPETLELESLVTCPF